MSYLSEDNTAVCLNIKSVPFESKILCLETYMELHAQRFKDAFVRMFNTILLKCFKIETLPASINNVFDK